MGRTNSYYIRKRHEDLVLREYHRHKYGPELADKLGRIAAESSEEDRERALEMAALDASMAKAGLDDSYSGNGSDYCYNNNSHHHHNHHHHHHGAASPFLIPNTGEAFLHGLMLRLRDFT